MEEFCGEYFWDFNKTWNNEVPDFSSCFKDTVLVSMPCLSFSIILIISAWCLPKHLSINPLPWTWLNVSKIIVSFSLLITSALWCGYIFREKTSGSNIPHSVLVSSCSRVAVFILVTMNMFLHRIRGVTTSAILSVFWILFTVFSVILHRSVIVNYFILSQQPASYMIFVLSMIFYPLIYIELVLSAFTDEKDFRSLNESNVMDEVTLLSYLTFSWFNKIIYKSRKKILDVGDFAFLSVKLTAEYVHKTFSQNWEFHFLHEDLQSRSLIWALIKSFWPWIVTGVVLDFLFVMMLFLPPLILDRIIDFVHHDQYTWRGYFFSIIIYISVFVGKTLQNNSVFLLILSGAQLKSALISAVYRKHLKISTSTRKGYSSGTLMNLVSVDVERIEEFSFHCASLISSPIKILVIIFIMWQYIGPSCLAGVAVMSILIPICMYSARLNERFSDKQMELKDIRLKYMNEILSGIRILKLYAWELPFASKVSDARREELKLIRNTQLCEVAIGFVFFSAPFMVSLASFATYLLVDSNNVLDPTKAFVSLTLMDQLRYALFEIPDALSELIQCGIALERLRKFFITENVDSNIIGSNPDKGDLLTMKNATFSWESGSKSVLLDINLRVHEGALIAIIGPVGSGKSSMLSAILGELHKTNGSVDIKGNMAYVPQQAWILNRSLKDNILLVKNMREEKYNKILDLCCLRPDLEILPAGDETEIGEKGVNLSGGQKQRISLARAVFQDKDIYLMDDPLSAVDVHVRKSLFDDVLSHDGLLKKKTRILVTHDVSILHKVDLIVSMKDGRIDEIGSYQDLLKRGGSFTLFVREHTTIKTMEENLRNLPRYLYRNKSMDSAVSKVSREGCSIEENTPSNMKNEENLRHLPRSFSRYISMESTASKTSFEEPLSEGNASSHLEREITKENIHRLTENENMEIGGVNRRIYWEYVKQTGLPIFLTSVFGYVSFMSFETGANIWLSEWSSDSIHNDTQSFEATTYRLYIYGILGIAQALSVVLAGTMLVYGTRRASESYHNRMLNSVIKSPMSFFDSTPMGRIMNRFSTDMDVMDIQIYPVMDGWFNCLLGSLASFIIIGMNTPIFLIIILPIAAAYFLLQRLHLHAFRQTMRLESTTRSPIYSHFLESIQGVSSICAYKVQEDFTNSFEDKLNKHMLCCFTTASCNRWLHFWLDTLGCFIVFVATVLALQNRYTLGPAVVGLMITYALSVTDGLMWFVRMNTELENKSISIERLDEYCKLKSEAPWSLAHDSFQQDWPQSGNIVFDGYSTRYTEELDLVLKEINLLVHSNEKVGIVGRTGAGKSSITMALFRIIEPVAGKISIDNIDITTIGLHCLRSKLTIIPQDPVLFTGTLRMNLDPKNEYREEEVWESLEKAHLKTFVASLAEGLNYNLEESGANFSAGQRQLLCLARALLKQTKILVLDEATASVDMDTDCLIQNTIRTAFSDHTVITIAHRLNTIIDYDKIVVMENGCVIEVGNPAELLKDTESKFYQMNKDSGLI